MSPVRIVPVFFRLTNLKDTIYRVVAIQDDSRDYKYTPEAEMFVHGYLGASVVMTMTRVDTFRVVDKIVGQDTTMRGIVSSHRNIWDLGLTIFICVCFRKS